MSKQTLIIFIPNIISLLMGLDGLTSFILDIDPRSLSPGISTIITNHLGVNRNRLNGYNRNETALVGNTLQLVKQGSAAETGDNLS